MVEKAYIEKVIDKYSYIIRIPKYNSILSSNQATSPNRLYTAYVCSVPGIEPRYVIGDIVWVAFESNYIDRPVILGRLYNSNKTESKTYINSNTDFYFNLNEYSSKIQSLAQEISHCLHFELKRVIDANNQYKTGILLCKEESTHIPQGCEQGILIILPFNSESEESEINRCTQLFISVPDTSNNTTIYSRVSKEDGTWENWKVLHG